MGPAFWGFNIPQPYQSVSYRGTVKIHGQNYAFSGSSLYS
jgi:hypothetical protein